MYVCVMDSRSLATKAVVPRNEMSQVRIGGISADSGAPFSVPIILRASGDENALGFSITFDPRVLGLQGVRLGPSAVNGSLLVNENLVQQGLLGIALALAPNQSFARGEAEILELDFLAKEADSAETMLSLGDTPVIRELVSKDATPSKCLYFYGRVSFAKKMHLKPLGPFSEGQVRFEVRGEVGKRYRLEMSADLENWELVRNLRLEHPTSVLHVKAENAACGFYRIKPLE